MCAGRLLRESVEIGFKSSTASDSLNGDAHSLLPGQNCIIRDIISDERGHFDSDNCMRRQGRSAMQQSVMYQYVPKMPELWRQESLRILMHSLPEGSDKTLSDSRDDKLTETAG